MGQALNGTDLNGVGMPILTLLVM